MIVELPRNLLKSAAEFMKYFRGILENLPRNTGGTDSSHTDILQENKRNHQSFHQYFSIVSTDNCMLYWYE